MTEMTDVFARPTDQFRVPKAAELVAAHLRRRIVRGELAEGDGLPSEAALMAEFSVSRPTLREAHRILEAEGLLSVRRGAHGGAKVHQPSAQVAAQYAARVLQSRGVLLSDVYEARLMIEGGVAGELANRKSRTDLVVLHTSLDEAASCRGNLVQLLDYHHRFHGLLIELVGNNTLTMLASMIDLILMSANLQHVEARQTDEAEIRSLRRALRTHTKVVELIENHDAEAATKLWRKHLAESATHVLNDARGAVALDVMP